MFGEKRHNLQEAPSVREKTVWEDLGLPELKRTMDGAKGSIEWRTEHNGIRLRFVIDVARTESDATNRLASVDIHGFDENASPEGMMTFKAACNRNQPGIYYDPQRNSREDKQTHTYWQVYYRRVEKAYRHNGLGTFGIELLEKLITMIGQRSPQAKGEWIQMDTQLSSVARLIADQEWLKGSGLGDYVSANRPDFHYLPHPKDEQDAFKLIAGVTEELDDVQGQSAPLVRFRKKLE
ncbi:MAG: hypothetical protein ACM3NH_01480 [Candidatus Saccharibacteria bacterium]